MITAEQKEICKMIQYSLLNKRLPKDVYVDGQEYFEKLGVRASLYHIKDEARKLLQDCFPFEWSIQDRAMEMFCSFCEEHKLEENVKGFISFCVSLLAGEYFRNRKIKQENKTIAYWIKTKNAKEIMNKYKFSVDENA